jgi:hypothetical protein
MFGLFQVENFFFVSLAIIFLLVILLVYLFKQRINSIETNETSMFGLLQKVVNEVKDLKRRVFCSGDREKNGNDNEEYDDDDDALDSNNICQLAAKEDDHIQYEIIEVNLSPTSALVKGSTEIDVDVDADEEDDEMDLDEIDGEEENEMDLDTEDLDTEDLDTEELDTEDLLVTEDLDISADADDHDDIMATENNISLVLDDLIDVSVIGDEEEDIVLDLEDFKASAAAADPILHDEPTTTPSLEKETATSATTSLKKMHIHELRRMAIAKGCLPDVVNKMKKSEILRLL